MEEYILEAMKYFTVEQWTKMDGSEQMKFGQVLYIYHACIHLGITIVIPDFMQKGKNVEEAPIETENRSKCLYCNIVFVNIEENNRHMNSCRRRFDFIQQKEYMCDNENYLNRHKLTDASEKTYFCRICKRALLSEQSLRAHINTIHSKKGKKFSCDKCPFQTNYKNNLAEHMQTHSDMKSFICAVCNVGFNTMPQLKRHSFKHSNKEKSFKCSYCEKSFLKRRDLEDHMNAVHLKIKPYKCNLCEYSASQKGQLKQHSYIHSNEKRFKCDHCSYSTLRKSNLKTHSYYHLDIKPFQCNICDYQCMTATKLDRHLKSKH